MANEEILKNRVEILAHIVTVSAIAIYVCGFVVLSLQHASLGLPQVNLLRPRILSAGVLLIVSAGIPALEILQISDVREFLAADDYAGKVTAGLRMVPALIMVLALSAFLFRPVLIGSVGSPGTHDYRALWGLIPFAVLIPSVHFSFPRWMWVRVLMVTLAATWLIFCMYRTMDKTLYILIGWFVWCAIGVLRTYGPMRSPANLWKVNLFTAVVETIGTLGFFAVYVYPRIPAMLGGGEALPATVSFILQRQATPNRQQSANQSLDGG